MKSETKAMLTIAVIGPGAMGCLIAGYCTQAGIDVILVDHRPERARRLDADGIRLLRAGKEEHVRVRTTAVPADCGPVGLVMVCVKAYDTRSAAAAAAVLAGTNSAVVSLQNGLGNLEALAEACGGDRVVGGVTAHGATLLGEGRVRHAATGSITLASLKPDGAAGSVTAAALLSGAGLPACVAADLDEVLWSKLVLNAAVNPVSALYAVTNGEVRSRPECWELASGAAREAAAVARAQGVRTAYDDEVLALEQLCRSTASNLSSMLQDVRSGRRTEIDAINGEIVGRAATAGVPVPINQRLWERVRQIGA